MLSGILGVCCAPATGTCPRPCAARPPEDDQASANMTHPTSLKLRRPDDWHVHLRDGALLELAVAATARQFGRAIVMPNLVPPVTTRAAATAYRDRILAN